MTIDRILELAMDGKYLDKEEAVQLLKIENNSDEFYKLISAANYMTRSEYKNKGLVFAQIGINAEPCSKNCKFCSMGKEHYSMENTWRKGVDTIISEVTTLIDQGIDDLFLMTTADYPFDKFLTISQKVREILPESIRFVANIDDFDYQGALKLKKVGFTGAYHINRLREGIDTTIQPETRINTLNAVKRSGLDLYYCVEPIGPEHSYEELADEMLRARDYQVGVMAVMRRIPVKGTPLYDYDQISAVELTKIAAVTRIVARPSRAMNAHEVTPMSIIAGVNQLYAEYGANPRDTVLNTEKNRGVSVYDAKRLLEDAEFTII
jgi:biotin synthase